jgi:hypothetical protein
MGIWISRGHSIVVLGGMITDSKIVRTFTGSIASQISGGMVSNGIKWFYSGYAYCVRNTHWPDSLSKAYFPYWITKIKRGYIC